MKAILFALICVYAFADEDLYSPFVHGKTVLSRLQTIRNVNKRNEQSLLKLEDVERKTQAMLEILYEDMKVAVDMKDRLNIEKQVEGLQTRLNNIRTQKRAVLRRMRKMADKISVDYRDQIVRKLRIENRVGIEQNLHIRREIENNQKLLLNEIKKLAHKYATKYAEIASAKMAYKVNSGKQSSTDIFNAKKKFKKAASTAYAQMYKKIVNVLEDATSEGVDNKDIKMVCVSAIDGIIRKINKEYLHYVVSKEEARREANKVVEKTKKRIEKSVAKTTDKKNPKNILKAASNKAKKAIEKGDAKKAKKVLEKANKKVTKTGK